jgi:hypothetical protein
MTDRPRRLVTLLGWSAALAGCVAFFASLAVAPAHGGAEGDKKRWDFEAEMTGTLPRGFVSEVGTWEVLKDGDNHVLAQRAQNGDRVFNLTLIEGTRYKDLDLSIRVKAVEGKNDQGGGVVWRARDKNNYYIARFNPLEPNLRVYKVEDGKRTQLDHAEAPGDRDWHTIRITMSGREIIGYLDGKKLLEAEDSTFPDAGKIGVWSKSDAQSYFDDLTVTAP